jgi:hypothetical protein
MPIYCGNIQHNTSIHTQVVGSAAPSELEATSGGVTWYAPVIVTVPGPAGASVGRCCLRPGARFRRSAAHVAAVADASICPILTLDGTKWREHAGDLDQRLHFAEIADRATASR